MNIIQDIREEMRAAWKEPSSRDLNVLALLFLVIPSVIGSYTAFWKGSSNGYVWIAAGIVLALSRIIPPLFRGIYRVWFGFSIVLGFFVSRLILTMVFWFIITPMALIMRVIGKDPMERKFDPNAGSYWRGREPTTDASIERYGKQF
jgi:uncharacterized membrane protein